MFRLEGVRATGLNRKRILTALTTMNGAADDKLRSQVPPRRSFRQGECKQELWPLSHDAIRSFRLSVSSRLSAQKGFDLISQIMDGWP